MTIPYQAEPLETPPPSYPPDSPKPLVQDDLQIPSMPPASLVDSPVSPMQLTEVPWHQQVDFPVLGTLQLLPLFIMVLVLWVRHQSLLVKTFSLIAVMTELILSVWLYLQFDTTTVRMQYAEQLAGLFGYHVAIDGVSLLFVLLTAFVFVLMVIYSLARQINELWKLMPTLLATEAVIMSLFMTINLMWFVMLSSIELLLVAYILLHWASSPEKDLARARYFQFMLVAMGLFYVGVIMLGWVYADAHHGQWSFDLFDLLDLSITTKYQTIIFFLLFYGLAIRTPLFPLHGWLPVFTTHGNVALAPALMLGLKVGIYGMLRFVLILTPDAVKDWHGYVVSFAMMGVFYAAVLAFMQKNLRRLLAFAVISHTSILIIGLFSLGHTSLMGSVMLSVDFGLAIIGLVFMAGFVYRRSQSLLLTRLGGLFDTIPLIGITFLIAGLAIVGMPGTPGFDAVHLILEAAMARFGTLITIVAAMGNVVAAGFLLWSFQRAFLTPRASTHLAGNENYRQPTTWGERLVVILFLLVLLSIGFYSTPLIRLIEVPLEGLFALYQHS